MIYFLKNDLGKCDFSHVSMWKGKEYENYKCTLYTSGMRWFFSQIGFPEMTSSCYIVKDVIISVQWKAKCILNYTAKVYAFVRQL